MPGYGMPGTPSASQAAYMARALPATAREARVPVAPDPRTSPFGESQLSSLRGGLVPESDYSGFVIASIPRRVRRGS